MITRDFFRSRIVNEVSLIALGTFAALGPNISPSISLGLPLRIDIAALAFLSAVLAGASSRGLRISPEDFDARAFRVNALLVDVPLHDAWAIDLKGHPSPTLEELGDASDDFHPFKSPLPSWASGCFERW